MFRGITMIQIDEKGRLMIPSRHRATLKLIAENQLVVTIDTQVKCLLLYPLSQWEEIEDKIEALPSFDPMARRVQRLLLGHATEVGLDNQGRLLVPQILRDYAELDRSVVLVGQGKKFEVWAQSLWESQRDSWLAANAAQTVMPEEMRLLSL